MSSNNIQILLSLVLITISSLTFGIVNGIEIGKNSATRETVKICVEKPSACKTKYDYYKLENQKWLTKIM